MINYRRVIEKNVILNAVDLTGFVTKFKIFYADSNTLFSSKSVICFLVSS